MKKLLAVLKKVLHPPKLVLLIVSAVVFSALILIFLTERLNSAAAYPIFVLSAYCLTILLLPLPKLIRNAKTGISICISRVPFVRRYMDDISFRGSVGIYQGAAVNFFYVVFRIYAGIRYASMWGNAERFKRHPSASTGLPVTCSLAINFGCRPRIILAKGSSSILANRRIYTKGIL